MEKIRNKSKDNFIKPNMDELLIEKNQILEENFQDRFVQNTKNIKVIKKNLF